MRPSALFFVLTLALLQYTNPTNCLNAFALQQNSGFLVSSNSLDIVIQPLWMDGGNVKFKISFLDKYNHTTIRLVRYNVIISNPKENKTVFDAAEETVGTTPIGQSPSLFSFNGTAIVPAPTEQSSSPAVKLDAGSYTLNVIVYAIGSNILLQPESVQIPFQATSEFPSDIASWIVMPSAILVVIATNVIAKSRTRNHQSDCS
jgi:hypothetical protein